METISTDRAPEAVGAYSQAVVRDGLIVTSGQVGLDPDSGEMVDAGVEAEIRQALDNLLAVVEAGGGSESSILKTTVYLTDLDHYDLLNEVYHDYFSDFLPARSVVEVSDLPAGASVEIEAISSRS
jgi:2-iminobutanoate/2-iminopropanoate deaminase